MRAPSLPGPRPLTDNLADDLALPGDAVPVVGSTVPVVGAPHRRHAAATAAAREVVVCCPNTAGLDELVGSRSPVGSEPSKQDPEDCWISPSRWRRTALTCSPRRERVCRRAIAGGCGRA